MNAQNRRIEVGADVEARRNESAVIFGLGINMFDAIDALDDGLKRLGDELDCFFRLQPVGGDADVNHWHRYLRFLFTR